jgi:mannan endo-1,4-beta-mannosidase
VPDRRATLASAGALAVVLIVAGVIAWRAHSAGARTILFGLDVPGADLGNVSEFSAAVGHRPTTVSVFIKLDTTGTTHKLDALRVGGYIPFVTLEPWSVIRRKADDPQFSLSTIVDGTHDDTLRAQARAIAASSGPVYLRLAHEMNGNWYPWAAGVNGNTPQLYVAAWRHVHQVFQQTPGVHVEWVWSPAADNLGSPAVQPAPFYPGDAYVDFVGLTGYEHNDPQPGHTFGKTIAELRAVTGRPVILSEIGADGPNKLRWLAALGAYILSEPAIAGFVYYDTAPSTTGASGTYALESASEFSAFRSALASINRQLPQHTRA